MALILRYFTEFGSFRGVLRKSGWMCRRKKVHVRISSPDALLVCTVMKSCIRSRMSRKRAVIVRRQPILPYELPSLIDAPFRLSLQQIWQLSTERQCRHLANRTTLLSCVRRSSFWRWVNTLFSLMRVLGTLEIGDSGWTQAAFAINAYAIIRPWDPGIVGKRLGPSKGLRKTAATILKACASATYPQRLYSGTSRGRKAKGTV